MDFEEYKKSVQKKIIADIEGVNDPIKILGILEFHKQQVAQQLSEG